MFSVIYVVSELRRRAGRTALTALGLAVGVALVVAVGALTDGLDDAQEQVLDPLTGVGTDISVSRPLAVEEDSEGARSFGPGLGGEERELLEEENEGVDFSLDFSQLGDPGERFEEANFLSSELSFSDESTADIESLAGVEAVAEALTLNIVQFSGEVPEESAAGGFAALADVNIDSVSISGVDLDSPELAAVTPEQVADGDYLSGSGKEVLVSGAFAGREGIEVGDRVPVGSNRYEVVGIVDPPLGGDSSDYYLELGELQRTADRGGRVNELRVRATDASSVAAVASEIESTIDRAEVITASDLAERVGGSLTDAKDLSSKLGTALVIVGLLAAVMIASLLTLTSVTKRVRELGTLKALGWPQRRVVGQIAGESIALGVLGGILGAILGLGSSALISALDITLEASVAGVAAGPGGAFGQGTVSGTEEIVLSAPADPSLLLVAIVLAVGGGLLAGVAGGLRAARLRPADAMRHVD